MRGSYCLCDPSWRGEDCSITTRCDHIGGGCKHGTCIYSTNFDQEYCECDLGWNGDDCSNPIIQISPAQANDIGGGQITVSFPSGMTFTQFRCLFASTIVPGVIGSNFTCKVPPYYLGNIYVNLSISVDDQDFVVVSSFYYINSEILSPPSEFFFDGNTVWVNGATRTLTWNPETFLEAIVTAKLYTWICNFSGCQLVFKYDLLTSPNTGSMNVTLDVSPFTWDNPLYMISIETPSNSINQYVVPIDNATDFYPNICASFIQRDTPIFNAGLSCPSLPPTVNPTFTNDAQCRLGNYDGCFPYYYPVPYSQCVRFLLPIGSVGFGFKCCYLNVGLNQYLIKPLYEQNGVLLDRSKNVVQNFNQDLLPRISCCSQKKSNSASCVSFQKNRPLMAKTVTEVSTKSKVAACYGDPHFLTFDGKRYTFNGKGEYTLLERIGSETPFVIQSRFVQIQDKKVTVASAYAIQDGEAKLLIYLDSLSSQIIFYVDSYQNPLPTIVIGDNMLLSSSIQIDRIEENKYQIYLPSQVILTVFTDYSLLSLFIYSPSNEGFFGKTRGLLGTLNDNINDEFTLKDGTIVPIDSPDRTILSQFGEMYRILKEDSLFIYPAGKTFDDFNDPLFTPTYGPKFATQGAEDQARTSCRGAMVDFNSCLEDVSNINTLAAVPHQKVAQLYDAYQSSQNTGPSIENLSNDKIVRIFETKVIQFQVSVQDEAQFHVKANTQILGTLDLKAQTYSFVGTEEMYQTKTVPSLELIATDTFGASSTLALSLEVGSHE